MNETQNHHPSAEGCDSKSRQGGGADGEGGKGGEGGVMGSRSWHYKLHLKCVYRNTATGLAVGGVRLCFLMECRALLMESKAFLMEYRAFWTSYRPFNAVKGSFDGIEGSIDGI